MRKNTRTAKMRKRKQMIKFIVDAMLPAAIAFISVIMAIAYVNAM